MQRFCSLQEVAQAYEIPLQDLVEELERCVNQSKNTKGVSHDNPL